MNILFIFIIGMQKNELILFLINTSPLNTFVLGFLHFATTKIYICVNNQNNLNYVNHKRADISEFVIYSSSGSILYVDNYSL